MKLNYRNTLYIGIVFFIISLFWYSYDMMIARTLIDKYGLNQTWSGVVMAFDNVMAVILLPLFGALSDKSNNKKGKRTPYIIVGTLLSAFAFMAIAYPDYVQTKKIQETDVVEQHYNIVFSENSNIRSVEHWQVVVTAMSNEREESYSLGLISQKQLTQYHSEIKEPISSLLDNSTNELSTRDVSIVRDIYYKYLSQRAWEVTSADPSNLVTFGVILFVALFAMTIYRSPAIALMPDVTRSHLRSKANAVITLMGAFGGVIAIYIIMVSGLTRGSYDHHAIIYISTGLLMILSLGIFLWKVNEPELVLQKDRLEKTSEKEVTNHKATFKRRKSLYFLLITVFLLFMGYNAVTSKMADYFPKVLNINFYDIQFIVAQIIVLLFIIPIGLLSMKLGRKRTVLFGMVILACSMCSVFFLKQDQAWLTAAVVAIVGIGVLMISINMYVMIIELSDGEIGKYTGYYYLAAMSAQIVTPFLSGALMDEFGRIILFPYATVFIVLALITMVFTKDAFRHNNKENK